ncbi:MAG: flagellar motor switch protein FliM [Verrucomicrobia bacterium]|nr:flagellar motor switch protein FliM [Verrucomicrobiota bacterium]
MSDAPVQPAAEFLAQSEVETLLVPPPEPAVPQHLLRADGQKGKDAPLVVPYDFRNPAFLSEIELRRLRLIHEDFIRYLSARLSLHLRMEFGLKLSKLATATYTTFTEALPNATHLSLFKIEPLVGVGIFELNPRLALAIADRLLGGRGQAAKSDRSLTEIEVALIEDVLLIFLEEWCSQWKSERELSPILIGHENNGRFLQTSPKDAIILTLTLDATFGECSEPIQIGVPYYLIEPLLKQMQNRRHKESAIVPTEKRAEWQPAYDRITVPVRAEWSDLELTLRELASLRVGDVIELPASLFQETRVLLNGTPKFIGSAGHDADRVAIQLTRKLPPEEPIHAIHNDGRKNP